MNLSNSLVRAPKPNHPDVYIGRDGWLFLIGGSNKARSLYNPNSRLLPDSKLQAWVKRIEDRARRLEEMGIQYLHLSVPEKLTIYDNKFNDPPVVDWRLSPSRRLREMLRDSPYAHVWVDLIEPMRAARDQEELYMKTDSHWSVAGCFLAYKALCERIGIPADADLLRTRKYLDYGAYMDLGMKLDPPVAEVFKWYDFAQNARRVYVNPIAQYLEAVTTRKVAMHVGSHVAFKNEMPTAANKRILIFGDSASSQRANGLTGMLAEGTREVEFIWSSNLDWAYISKTRPDVLVYQLVERFLTIVPKDKLSLRWVLASRSLQAKWLRRKALRKSGAPA
jgi:alginate O-acetyltransferase complex protein AlgJ